MELDLKEYLQIIRKRIWLIATIVVLSCLVTGLISYFYIKPQYAASTKLIVNSSYQAEGISRIDYSEVSASIMLVNTYKEIIQTPAILDKVATQLPELQLTADEIISRVKVSAVNETQVLTITVTDYSHDTAVKLVNAISNVFKTDIPQIMKVDNVTLLNQAKQEEAPFPVKPNPKMNIVIAFILSALIGVGLAFLLEYLDDTLKSEKEIEQYLGLPTLAVISRIKASDVPSNVPSKPEQKVVGESVYASANQ
ncbi:Wzz/FepE/Etk N-terminal domain-containing protein [Paenibacillus chitinolyticus]|uniref:YveK family protein n=1 Tax=Paenibacillus chitinolyticus TaxID=79263 RepID=UPI002DB5AFE1|nr:Wzz/FepE/Etk N-terminal domain-containing protein [Paenibacillus chitinolyticus]MEC0247479.1 Wzz/FepE/Etk N-terminal domain-containing protein [Paenibacillus chitinolyticus]